MCIATYGTVRDFCIRNPAVRSVDPLCEGCCCSLRSHALRPPEDPHGSSQGAASIKGASSLLSSNYYSVKIISA